MNKDIEITSLSVKEGGPTPPNDVPFLSVNITLKVAKAEEDWEHLWEAFKAESEKYRRVFSIKDPVAHEKALLESYFRKSTFRESLRILPEITSSWSRTLTSPQEKGLWFLSDRADFWRSLNWGWLEGRPFEDSPGVNSEEDLMFGYVHSVRGKNNEKPNFTWTYHDPSLVYLEKFDTFWLRECVSDCPVTRSIIEELSHYKETGKLLHKYRFTDGSVILRHLKTLDAYWD